MTNSKTDKVKENLDFTFLNSLELPLASQKSNTIGLHNFRNLPEIVFHLIFIDQKAEIVWNQKLFKFQNYQKSFPVLKKNHFFSNIIFKAIFSNEIF